MSRTGMMALLIAGIGMLMPVVASTEARAAKQGCSFRKTVQQGGYLFDVSSRPADGCAVQIVEVVVRRGGKQLARLKSDVDFLAEGAWSADLDGEGRPELVVASRSVKVGGRGTLDVYWLEGSRLRRAEMPAHEEGAGYRGEDTFRPAGHRILRSFPLYRDGDPDGRPGGGTRSMQYLFRGGELVQSMNSDDPGATAPPIARPSPRKPPTMRPLPTTEYPRAAPPGLFPPETVKPVK